jgi:formiminoglutamase
MGNALLGDATLRVWNREMLEKIFSPREGETKIGEEIQLLPNADLNLIADSTARYVLLGIPEDIGVRANLGVGGAHTAWLPSLKAFLNVQSTDLISGSEVLLLGDFVFDDALKSSVDADLQTLRKMVSEIDDLVLPVIETIVRAGKIPIVIGGGHNNAYPIIKGVSKGLGAPINAINMDAHSDFRVKEGRHSGNGFRYASDEGYLDACALPALHASYNSQVVLNDMHSRERIFLGWFEDIFLKEEHSFKHTVQRALDQLAGRRIGIELDLDCITGVLSSAATPTGITAVQARQYLRYCAVHSDYAYLHICEGATELRDGRKDSTTAKLIAYMISDFVRAGNERV